MTAQAGESIFYMGKWHSMFSCPLEDYFEKNPPRPDFKRMSSACLRGYHGVWEICKDQLYLVELHSKTGVELPSIFRGLPENKVLATWFSGELRLIIGELFDYEHLGFFSTYEYELFLTIEDGRLLGSRLIDHLEPANFKEWMERREEEVRAFARMDLGEPAPPDVVHRVVERTVRKWQAELRDSIEHIITVRFGRYDRERFKALLRTLLKLVGLGYRRRTPETKSHWWDLDPFCGDYPLVCGLPTNPLKEKAE